MPKAQFRKGDLVSFRFATRFVQGEVKEDRGPIGINGRNLYLVAFRLDPQSASQSEIESRRACCACRFSMTCRRATKNRHAQHALRKSILFCRFADGIFDVAEIEPTAM
jgi:hypothetical protein